MVMTNGLTTSGSSILKGYPGDRIWSLGVQRYGSNLGYQERLGAKQQATSTQTTAMT